jgi:hypothetical protein
MPISARCICRGSFQYHQQISHVKVMPLLYLSPVLALFADLCIALKAYFANTNTDIPLRLRFCFSASLLVAFMRQ